MLLTTKAFSSSLIETTQWGDCLVTWISVGSVWTWSSQEVTTVMRAVRHLVLDISRLRHRWRGRIRSGRINSNNLRRNSRRNKNDGSWELGLRPCCNVMNTSWLRQKQSRIIRIWKRNIAKRSREEIRDKTSTGDDWWRVYQIWGIEGNNEKNVRYEMKRM